MFGESEGTRGAATVEEIGRRRTFLRTMSLAVVLLLVQQPMRDAVGDLAGSAADCAIPGRLSLLVDGLFICAYVYAAYRAYKYVRFLRRPGWLGVARVGVYLVSLAAVLDIVEDVKLWHGFGAETGACPGLSTGWFTWLMRASLLAGVLVLAVCLFATSRYGQRTLFKNEPGPSQVTFKRVADDGPDAGRLVICCSGGGIRSASFCLGALQLLRERNLYDKASSVIGVSGGGYMAAAFHVLRRDFDDPFAPGSPELSRLRRQTRYLLQGGRSMFRAALSVLFGLIVNLLLIGIVLRAVAWVLGWFLADQGVVKAVGEQIYVDWRPGGSWLFAGLSVALLVLGAALFMVEKIWDRWSTMPDLVRSGLTGLGGLTLLTGTPVALLLLGVPGGLYLLGKLPGTNNPDQPSLPKALLDLVDPTKQGLASFAALVVALIGLGRTVWNGLMVESNDPSQSGLRGRLIAFGRNKLAPWLGSAIILLAGIVVLLRWTGGYATDRSYQEDWSVAWALVGIAVAIKVLTDANRTSLHPFYRERLSRAFLVKRQDNGAAVSLDYSMRLRYSEWAKPKGAGPQLIVAAVGSGRSPCRQRWRSVAPPSAR